MQTTSDRSNRVSIMYAQENISTKKKQFLDITNSVDYSKDYQ